MLVAAGADPNVPTMKPAGRARFGDMLEQREVVDLSGLPPAPIGGPSVTPLHAAAGVGYGEGFGANSHRFAPTGMLAAVKYLVEELGLDVNAADHEGNTALHHAAARGDNEMILLPGVERRQRQGRRSRGENDGRYGQRARAAHSTVSRDHRPSRKARSKE